MKKVPDWPSVSVPVIGWPMYQHQIKRSLFSRHPKQTAPEDTKQDARARRKAGDSRGSTPLTSPKIEWKRAFKKELKRKEGQVETASKVNKTVALSRSQSSSKTIY